MKYVVDCSVAFKWVVPEVDSDKALRLREGYRNGVHELIAPDIFPAEVANALLMAERRGRIPAGQFPSYLADILTTTPDLHLTRPLLGRVAVITATFRVSVYDGLYVALAEREGCELVTADDRLVRNLQGKFSFVIPLASLP
jgi:predicted nucleic acid-binding protein